MHAAFADQTVVRVIRSICVLGAPILSNSSNELSGIEERSVTVSDLIMPSDDSGADGVFVTESYNFVSYSESAADDLLGFWQQILGK